MPNRRGDTENQFSLTRAARNTRGRAISNFSFSQLKASRILILLPILTAWGFLISSTAGGDLSELDARIDFMKHHFGEMSFKPEGGFILRKGQVLPKLVWDEPGIAAALLKNTTIPTRWFDGDLNEVDTAEKTGTYYAYGEAPVPKGYPLCRAMTCCCVEQEEDLDALAIKLGGEEHNIGEIVKSWQENEESTIVLCRQIESGPPYQPKRPGQWLMENASVHVRLKRKIRNIESPPVEVKARRLEGDPAPILSDAPAKLTDADRQFKADMEGLLARWHEDSKRPMSVVVTREGIVIVSKGYGEMEGKPVTVNTPMLLHSAMKPILGLQLAMYVDRGYAGLDEPIGKYLPEFDTPEDRQLTFRAAQTHLTGIHFPWALAFSRHFYFHTWHEALISQCPRNWAPGERYLYGCVGMSLSVRAIETLTGKNYWEAMEAQLFAPLGIKDMHPGGTGFSAEDLARLGILVANKGKYGPWELFSEETCAAIMPVSLRNYFPQLDEPVVRGIGFTTMARGFYGHSGGCGTCLLVDPENHIVLALTRMQGDERYNDFRKDAFKLLQSFATALPPASSTAP